MNSQDRNSIVPSATDAAGSKERCTSSPSVQNIETADGVEVVHSKKTSRRLLFKAVSNRRRSRTEDPPLEEAVPAENADDASHASSKSTPPPEKGFAKILGYNIQQGIKKIASKNKSLNKLLDMSGSMACFFFGCIAASSLLMIFLCFLCFCCILEFYIYPWQLFENILLDKLVRLVLVMAVSSASFYFAVALLIRIVVEAIACMQMHYYSSKEGHLVSSSGRQKKKNKA